MSFYRYYFLLPGVHISLQFNSLRIPLTSSLLSLLRPLTWVLNKIDSNGNPSATSSKMLQFQWVLANLPERYFELMLWVRFIHAPFTMSPWNPKLILYFSCPSRSWCLRRAAERKPLQCNSVKSQVFIPCFFCTHCQHFFHFRTLSSLYLQFKEQQ